MAWKLSDLRDLVVIGSGILAAYKYMDRIKPPPPAEIKKQIEKVRALIEKQYMPPLAQAGPLPVGEGAPMTKPFAQAVAQDMMPTVLRICDRGGASDYSQDANVGEKDATG